MHHTHRITSATADQRRLTAVVVAVLGSLVVVAGFAPGPLAARPAGAAAAPCAGETGAGAVRVAIVVDYGTDPGAPGGPSVQCLTLASGANGGDLLRERAVLLGRSLPRYAASGLLCGLDGWPGAGCGDLSGGTYRYWAYWSGTGGSWVYGGGNPFTRRLHDGDIEGWRFTAGAGNASDPPPGAAPDASALFPAAPAPGGDASGGSGAGPGAAAPVGGGGATGGDGTGGASAASGADPAANGEGTDATGAAEVEAATASAPSVTATTAAAVDPGGADLAAAPASAAGGASGPPIGLIAGVLVIAGLGGAAAVRFRRRPEA